MYGVPPDLPVQRFVGDYLAQVSIGMDGVHFVFGDAGIISVGGTWEVRDRDGTLIDCAQEHVSREAYRVHVLLNKLVTAARLAPPESFTLTFDSGHELTVIDIRLNTSVFRSSRTVLWFD